MNAGRNQVAQRLIHQAVAGYGIDAGKFSRALLEAGATVEVSVKPQSLRILAPKA